MSQRMLHKIKTCAPLTGALQLFALSALAAPGELATQPLTFVISPQPNIMLLFDDSGSMGIDRMITNAGQAARGQGVDGIGGGLNARVKVESDDQLYELCVGYNSLAYNPNVQYKPWVSVSDSDDTNYVFDDKTLATALDNPIDPLTVTDLSEHIYVQWIDRENDGVEGELDVTLTDSDGLMIDGECGRGVVAYDSSTEESSQIVFPINNLTVDTNETSGIVVDSGGDGNYIGPNPDGSDAGSDPDPHPSGVGDGIVKIDLTSNGTKDAETGLFTFTVTAFNVDRGGDSDGLTIYGGEDISDPLENAVKVTSVFNGVAVHPGWGSLNLNQSGDSLSITSNSSGNLDKTIYTNGIEGGQVETFTVTGRIATLVFDPGSNQYQRSGFVIGWQHSDHIATPTPGNGDGVVTKVDCTGSTSNCKVVSELPVNVADPNYNAAEHGFNTQQNYANWYTYHRNRDFVAKNALADIIRVSNHRVGLATVNDRGDGGVIAKDMSDQSESYDSVNSIHTDKDTLLKRLYQANTFGSKELKDALGNFVYARDSDGNIIVDNGVNRKAVNDGTALRKLLDNTGRYFQEGESPEATYLGYDITNTTLRSASHSAEVAIGADGSSASKVLDNSTHPTPQLSNQYGGQCQQNFALLVTDGTWNGSLEHLITRDGNDAITSDLRPGNADADDTSEGADYDGGNYADNYSNTLADVAMKYFETDLSTTLDNRLSVSLHDQTIEHQHMVTFGIGFGVTGSIDQDPTVESVTWTDPFNGSNSLIPPERVDDVLHAAYNGRGGYFNATDPDALQESLDAIVQEINVRTENAATGASFSSYRLNDGTLRYDVSYRTETWWGDIEAYRFENGAFLSTRDWSADTIMSGLEDAERLNRKIITFNGTNGVEFAAPANLNAPDPATEISPTQITDLLRLNTDAGNADTYLSDIINYIKGDSSNEVSNGGGFRSRAGHYLGALIHSQPQYVGAPDAAYRDSLEGDANSYGTFVNDNRYRRPIVYVGGNDGMLHAFYASNNYEDGSEDGASDTLGGTELFAYIPHILSEEDRGGRRLSTSADTVYQNTPYVDGDLRVADVFVDKQGDNTRRWRTYLVGGLRAGGRGIYVLDVTNPTDDATNNADDIVVREFTHDDLGYVYGPPVITRVHNSVTDTAYPGGRWAAIVPSGYWSTADEDTVTGDGAAKLFIIYLDKRGAESNVEGVGYDIIEASNHTFTSHNPGSTVISINEHRYVQAVYTNDSLDPSEIIQGQVLDDDFRCEITDDAIDNVSGYTLTSCNVSETDINGLSPPTVIDLNNDGTADRVYAGDLHGNMWVFNIQSKNSSDWAVDDDVAGSSNNQPLFTACRSSLVNNICPDNARQPIMIAPQVVSHPERLVTLNTANTLVLFGTGQYLTADDQDDTSMQSIYGVWDAGSSKRYISRSNLTEQTFTNVDADGTAVTNVDEAVGRTGSLEAVNYSGVDPSTGAEGYGWYIDLPATLAENNEFKERTIISPLVIEKYLIFATFIPADGHCSASSGSSFLNAVFVDSGEGADIFDEASTGSIKFSGFKVDGAIVGTQHLKDDDGKNKVAVSTDANENLIIDTNISGGLPSGRQSWSILR